MLNHYTLNEDVIIEKCVNEQILNGGNLKNGFRKAASKIQAELGKRRGIKSIQNRWYRINYPSKLSKSYSLQEDNIIINCVITAVIENNGTFREGFEKATKVIQEKCGKTRTLSSIKNRWYKRIYPVLSHKLQKELKVTVQDLKRIQSKKAKKSITATDIVNIAQKYSRNPIHVLGMSGNINKNSVPKKETKKVSQNTENTEIVTDKFTIRNALQIAEEIENLNRQVQAQKNLIRALTRQLVSTNKYRVAYMTC